MISNEIRRSGYALHYTTQPGKSSLVEPQGGSLPYDLAYRNPRKFYDVVMSQSVKTHKLVDSGNHTVCLTTKLGQRKIGRIMQQIQVRLIDQLKSRANFTEKELEAAMQDQKVQQTVNRMVRQKTIEFVDPNSNKPMLAQEMQVVGQQKGEIKLREREVEDHLKIASLRVKEKAFAEVKDEI